MISTLIKTLIGVAGITFVYWGLNEMPVIALSDSFVKIFTEGIIAYILDVAHFFIPVNFMLSCVVTTFLFRHSIGIINIIRAIIGFIHK